MSTKDAGLPRIARYKPFYRELVKGRAYLWCSCGLSQDQPFCDGSHKDTGFEPLRYVAQEDREVLFCGCKQTRGQPFCDGTHNNLLDTYEEDDPDSEANRAVPLVTDYRNGRVQLNGNCFVADMNRVPRCEVGNIRWSALTTLQNGARYQSQFYLLVEPGLSPVVSFGDREVILLVASGTGEIEISARKFPLEAIAGVHVRAGEAFRIDNRGGGPIELYLSVCPQAGAPVFLDAMPDNFSVAHPRRTVSMDSGNRQSMADRFFQILVDKQMGASMATQFIGEVPLSKAAVHRHLYEETLVVLKGEGCMWTRDFKAPVKAGDTIFLPRKQPHSLQCTDPAGMLLAGVICPGDNPSINY